MPTLDETPQYRVIEPCFFEPDLLAVGTIIATNAPPGPHLEPWNEAAKVAMEDWLSQEIDEIDPLTKKPTGRKIAHHAGYRRVEYNPAAQMTATIIEPPEAEDAAGKTLAELRQVRATDPRPPAARRFKKTSPVAEDPPKATVIAPGPKATTVTGGPG